MSSGDEEELQSLPGERGWVDRCAVPGKRRVRLQADGVDIPVLLVAGPSAGRTLVVTAAVHGDEFEGVRALQELYDELDPSTMRGRLIAVPVTNMPAYEAAARRSPLDDADLARTFPGRPDGAPSERLAYLVAESIISLADFYVDLHSGGVRYRMPTMVGYEAGDERAAAAARIFGAPVHWMHDEIPPGRTVSYARSKGIPWLYTEAAGAGRIAAGDLAMMKRGVRRLLQHLEITPCEESLEGDVVPLSLRGDGNTDAGIEAGADGLLHARVELLDMVNAGDLLGELRDPFGRIVERYLAPRDGVVALVHEFARVRRGESLFLLAEKV